MGIPKCNGCHIEQVPGPWEQGPTWLSIIPTRGRAETISPHDSKTPSPPPVRGDSLLISRSLRPPPGERGIEKFEF